MLFCPFASSDRIITCGCDCALYRPAEQVCAISVLADLPGAVDRLTDVLESQKPVKTC